MRRHERLIVAAVVLGLVALWEALVRLGWIDPGLAPAPTTVADALVRLAGRPEVRASLGVTGWEVLAAFLIALPTAATSQSMSLCRAKPELLELGSPLEIARKSIATRKQLRIIALGSSSTAGYGVSQPAFAYPAQLKMGLDRALPGIDVDVTNRGIGGEDVEEMVSRMRSEMQDNPPSLMVWQTGTNELVGGLYGVALGGYFCAESMFHRATDASKVALFYLVQHLQARGFTLLDIQVPTPHTLRLGAITISRTSFIERLRAAIDLPVRF